MTNEEREAMEWLETAASGRYEGCQFSEFSQKFARTIMAKLARPVMPEEFPEEAMAAMWEAGKAAASPMFVRTPPNDTMRRVFVAEYRALYAHLTKPAPKTEWRVHCSEESTFHADLVDAMRRVEFHTRKGRCVTIQQATVPA